jgi:dihydroorotate dehydrogenase
MSKENLVTAVYKGILPLTSGNPEIAHNLVFSTLKRVDNYDCILDSLRREFKVDNMPRITIDTLKADFYSPYLLAAGLIKTGVGAATITQLGVGGIDAGTFTLQRWDGNPLTRKEKGFDGKEISINRIKRYKDGTIINRMGLPNPGIGNAIKTLESVREKISEPIFLNVSADPSLKDKEAIRKNLKDVLTLAYIYKPVAITLNVSCPNVEMGEDREERLRDVLWTIKAAGEILDELEAKFKYRVPRLAKIGPDMVPEEIKEFVRTVKENHYEGIVATNTTTDRTGDRFKYANNPNCGLSGPYLLGKSLGTVRLVRKYDKELGGTPLVVIGCGGINSYEDYQKMRDAGSDDIVELMSGFIFGGPYFFKKLNSEYKQNNPVKKFYKGV